MWNPPAVGKMMERNNQESLTLLGQSYKKAADNIGIQKLAPTNIEDTLRQGGTFIFKGNTPLVAHYDEKVGDNYDIESTLGLIATKQLLCIDRYAIFTRLDADEAIWPTNKAKMADKSECFCVASIIGLQKAVL